MLIMPQKDIEKLIESVSVLIEEACREGDSVAAIAKRAGIPRPQVSRIRNGSCLHTPTVETLGKIAKCLGCVVEVRMKKLNG
jgi:transcriptional regulator with XRE-family HTH domain